MIFVVAESLSKAKMQDIGKISIVNAGKNYDVGLMMNKTAALLESFYKPFNERLSRIFKEDRWLWKDEV